MHVNIRYDFKYKEYIFTFLFLVDYFIYLDRLNSIDYAAIYFKYAFEHTKKMYLGITWHNTKYWKII